MDGYLVFLCVEALKIIFRNDDIAEAQFLGFGDTLFYTVHGAHLARESHFAAHAPAGLYRCIDIRGENGGDDAEVHSKVGHPESAGDIDEHILLHELEADALLEYGQQHVQSALVETCGGALWGAVGRR